MSDHADSADVGIFAVVSASLAAVRGRPALRPDCRCYFCDEVVVLDVLFCNDDCRDDYEKEQAALKRAGHL